MVIEKRKVRDLKFYEGNPRKIDEKTKEKLKKSILEFGLVEPLVVNPKNEVIGGNQRLKVLQELGIEEVEVVVVDLPKSKEKTLNLALNKIQGDWDFELLEEFIKDIELEDLELSGFEDFEIRDIEIISMEEEKAKLDEKRYSASGFPVRLGDFIGFISYDEEEFQDIFHIFNDLAKKIPNIQTSEIIAKRILKIFKKNIKEIDEIVFDISNRN